MSKHFCIDNFDPALLIMGGFQVLMVFAAYGLIAALVIGGSMAVGKLFFSL